MSLGCKMMWIFIWGHSANRSVSTGLMSAETSTLIRWLINKARPLMYSTALPPSIVAGISEALELVQTEHWRRERLLSTTYFFRSSLCKAGFKVGSGDSPIVPLIVGDNETALRFSSALEKEGIAAVAIRPPLYQMEQRESASLCRLGIT